MKISRQKIDKISEQIINFLYSKNPQLLFTSQIAHEIARDEEFIKKILIDLKKKSLLVEVKKNPKGKDYIRRSRWRLSDNAYSVYKNYQTY